MTNDDLLRQISELARRISALERIETGGGAAFVSACVSRPSYSNTVATNGSLTQPWNTVEWDTDSLVNGSNNIIIPTTGVWLLLARAQVTTTGIGGSLRIAGSTTGALARIEPFAHAHTFDYNLMGIVELVSGEQIDLEYRAGPSFSLSISDRSAPPTPSLSVTFLGTP